jgi:hypothetical protein
MGRRSSPAFMGGFFLIAALFSLGLSGCSKPSAAQAQPTGEVLLIPVTGRERLDSQPTPEPYSTAEPLRIATATPPGSATGQAAARTPAGFSQIRRLTEGGCCPGPFWSPNGEHVLFIDRPDPDQPAGVWQIPVDGNGSPSLFSPVIGDFSSDFSHVTFYISGQTMVERREDAQIWLIPSAGAATRISPDNQLVAWSSFIPGAKPSGLNREIWISDIAGTRAEPVVQLYGGSFVDWFPDGRMLLIGYSAATGSSISYWSYSLKDGEMVELARALRMRGGSISPGGGWLVYKTFFSPVPEENGLWLVNTATLERRKVEPFGGFRWRSEGRLLLAPLEPGSPSHRFIELEAATGEVTALTDSELLPFKIANGDFSVSPDGRRVAFVSAEDYNIWVLELP